MPIEITQDKNIRTIYGNYLYQKYMSYGAFKQPKYRSSIAKNSNLSNFTGFQCIIYN